MCKYGGGAAGVNIVYESSDLGHGLLFSKYGLGINHVFARLLAKILVN